MTIENKAGIRQARPIPGVAYSQYEITAQGNSKEELQANYEMAESVALDMLEKDQTICNRTILAKYLEEKDLSNDFIKWLQKNGK